MTPPPAVAPPRREVLLIDVPLARVRRPADLLALLATLVAIGVVLLLTIYADATTQGVTQDVQSVLADTLRQTLLLPVTVLEGVVSFVVPLAVIVERLIRWEWRSALEAVGAMVLAVLLVNSAIWLLTTAAPELSPGLIITSNGDAALALNVYLAGLAGVLTAAGDRTRSRLLRWSWGLLWVVAALSVLQGDQTLPGALVAVLLGRVAGLGLRYVSGVLHQRATGLPLVRALRRAGLDPDRIVRIDDTGHLPRAWRASCSGPVGYTERLRERARDLVADSPVEQTPGGQVTANLAIATPGETAAPSPASVAGENTSTARGAVDAAADGASGPASEPWQESSLPGGVEGILSGESQPDAIHPDLTTDPLEILAGIGPSAGRRMATETAHRLYAVWDVAGVRHDVVVLDGDRHVAGFLSSLWQSIRLKGLSRRPLRNLRDAADRALMMRLAVREAGVRTPEVTGVAEARDSVFLVTEHIPAARQLSDLSAEEFEDAVLDQVWRQVRAAHLKGLVHHSIHSNAILVDAEQQVWILGWDEGEILSTEISRRIDLAQVLAMLSGLVGTERALNSAARTLEREQLASVAPLLQRVILPSTTRTMTSRESLTAVRDELVELIPTADVAPLPVARFSPRTVITATIGVAALVALLSWMNFDEVLEAVGNADPRWIAASFGLGLLTYVGMAMTLVAFTPERLARVRTLVVQMAASVVQIVAPAGIGAAAINLRFLQRQRIPIPRAVATVSLVQVSQFLTTVLLLGAVVLLTGSAGALSAPSGPVIAVVAGVLGIAALAALVPQLRIWIWRRISPTLRQVWPRLVWAVSHPGRLAVGVVGNIIMTLGYVGAFGAALAAFGYTLPLSTLAIAYLVSNSVGALVPSPGGIGPVEAALTTGLTLAGIPAGAAVSTAILFRLLTFWGRAPLGWLALRYLQKRELV